MIVKVQKSPVNNNPDVRNVSFYQGEKVHVVYDKENASRFKSVLRVYVTGDGDQTEIFLLPEYHVELLSDGGKVIQTLSRTF